MSDAARFQAEYKKLNPAQKRAVDAIDGPVMVVAGPGTGKTQVLALRIANIITKTDTPPSGVLCLTFTNAGVRAMRERLARLMGARGNEVHVATFHRFAISLIEKHYGVLGMDQAPVLISDAEAIALADDILENREWSHLRPRGDSAKYFSDLKSLISLLKREHLSPSDFLAEVDAEIESVRTNPENISSRGARKGELKREAESAIASLERTREAVHFYQAYEEAKTARGLMDYDDVLTYAVRIAQEGEDARADIRENHLYVLVDEHQDSSGVQNAFLEAVWAGTEQPNIFVVGDDRQLIYGFGGASIEQFTRFRTLFGKAEEITLIQNYRSTQTILDTADALLQSQIAEGKLQSTSTAKEEKVLIAECDYPRDEIIFAAKRIREQIAKGVPADECAILVPKNYQARSAMETLREQGIPVAAEGSLSFFAQPETLTIRRIFSALADPYDPVSLGALFLDPSIDIPPLEAHRYLRANLRKISLTALIEYATSRLPTDPIARFGAQMQDFLASSQSLGLHGLVQKIGEVLFFDHPKDHESLLRQVECIRTFLHLLVARQEKNPHLSLADFSAYLDRLEQYGHDVPLAVFAGAGGVRVLTLHGSKGLEFQHVHIAHLDEGSLMRGRKAGFVLPERVQSRVEAKTEMTARRELYVAITRAKETCVLSYPRHSYTGGELVPAPILADLPDALITRESIEQSQSETLDADPVAYVRRKGVVEAPNVADVAKAVAEEYAKTNVSVTLLNNFFECPWKWYFRNILQVPEAKTESLLLGSVVHAGIEYLLKHRSGATAEALTATMRAALEKEFVSGEAIMKRTLREAEKIIGTFSKTYLPEISKEAVSERSVSYRDPQYPHLSCYGKIDMTERVEDRIVSVTDFKTGRGKSASVIEKRDEDGRMSSLLRQLAMYSYLIEGAEKGTEVAESKLLFLEEAPTSKDAVYAKRVSREEIELLRKDISDYDALIQNGQWVSRPCLAKSYGAGDTCEYCAKARELFVGL